MDMSLIKSLSIAEKVLIHLSKTRYDPGAETVPVGVAQEGIAESVGISRSHVPRAVKELLREGLVKEEKRYTEGGKKRKKVYLITPNGLVRAREAKERVLSQIVPAKINNKIVHDMTIEQLENAFHRRIDILKLTGAEQYIDLDSIKSYGVIDLSDSPEVSLFLDRENALEEMKQFLKAPAMILAMYGAKGMGTSSLVRYFFEMIEEWNILWISLAKYCRVEDIKERIDSFADRLCTSPEMMMNFSGGSNNLLVLDGYFHVDEPIVEFFSNLVERRSGAKIIVTCRDSTPSYNRFYRREQVESGRVQEMILKGFPKKDARHLLGNDEIPDEAFGRIYALVNGSPMILKMLRERDEEGLRDNTTFTNEEIRFLLIESSAKKKTS